MADAGTIEWAVFGALVAGLLFIDIGYASTWAPEAAEKALALAKTA